MTRDKAPPDFLLFSSLKPVGLGLGKMKGLPGFAFQIPFWVIGVDGLGDFVTGVSLSRAHLHN
jgi:hypothetical protein